MNPAIDRYLSEFGKLLANELAQWTAVVNAANIKVE